MEGLKEKYGPRLNLTLCYCSSEDEIYSCNNLRTQIHSSAGWQSKKNCEYPQELGFYFDGLVSLNVIRFLSHESKISSCVDVLIASASPEEVDKGIGVSYEGATFTRLGHVRFSMNEENNFAARELKTIGIRQQCVYIKFLFSHPFNNSYNLFHQVGLVGIAAHGTLARTMTLWSDCRISIPVAAVVKVALEEMTPFYHEDSPPRPYTADNFSNTTTKIRLQELQRLKQKAVAEEDYDLAAALKRKIDSVREGGKEIDELEKLKAIAVKKEDFEEAKMLKKRIDALRAASYLVSEVSTGVVAGPSWNQLDQTNVKVEKYDDNEETNPTGGIVNKQVLVGSTVPLQGGGEAWEQQLNELIFTAGDKQGHPDVLQSEEAGEGKSYEADLGIYAVSCLLSRSALFRKVAIAQLFSPDGAAILKKHNDSYETSLLTYIVSKGRGLNDLALPAAMSAFEGLRKFLDNNNWERGSHLMQFFDEALKISILKLGDKKLKMRTAAKSLILALSERPYGVDKVVTTLLEYDPHQKLKSDTKIEDLKQNSKPRPTDLTKQRAEVPPEYQISKIELFSTFVDSYGVGDQSPVNLDYLFERVLIPQLESPNKMVRDVTMKFIAKLFKLDHQRCAVFLKSVKPAQLALLEEEIKRDGSRMPVISGGEVDGEPMSVPRRSSRSASQEPVSKSTPRLATASSKSPQSRRGSRRLSQSSGVFGGSPRPIADDSLVSTRTCPFCKAFDENFTEENLDRHYYRSCPMLCPCPLCQQVTEISALQQHLVTECDGHGLVKECPRCREAVRAEDLKQHVEAAACIEYVPTHSVCPLCHMRFRSGPEGWRKHLTTAPGCLNNPRKYDGSGVII